MFRSRSDHFESSQGQCARFGATAFIISDSILGWGQFVVEKAWIHLAIMVTYHVAIVSLALSLAI